MQAETLALIFASLTGFSILIYALLDGYDLGVGILLPTELEKVSTRDTLISSIGPFWDANETWLVLAIGLLLVAFPPAHSEIMYHCYIPVTIMLIGLILRGVAFDFRAKAAINYKYPWDMCFKAGSLLATSSQGFILGFYVVGFDTSLAGLIFSLTSAFGVTAAYVYIGAAWLILKCEGQEQAKAAKQCLWSGRLTALGVMCVCFVNIIVNPTVFDRWFEVPLAYFVLILPLVCVSLFIANDLMLKRIPFKNDVLSYLPFLLVCFIFAICFIGLSFSFMPYIVPGKLTIFEAASAPESLSFILIGAVFVIPAIFMYTVFLHKIFWGKTSELRYY